MNDMFHHAKSFSQTLCWDVRGKETGNIFQGTNDAYAESNVAKCWELKHYGKNHKVDLSIVSEIETTGTVSSEDDKQGFQTTGSDISPGMRFLQVFLFSIAIVLAWLWLMIIRRYIRTSKEKQELLRKMNENARADDLENEISRDLSSSDTDDDYGEVEIVFDKPEDFETLRQNVFSESFFRALEGRQGDAGMMPVEHAIPAMAAMIQQEAYLQLEKQRRSQRAHASQGNRARPYNPGSSVRYLSNNNQDLDNRQVRSFEVENNYTIDDMRTTMSWDDERTLYMRNSKRNLLDSIQIHVQDPATSTSKTIIPAMYSTNDWAHHQECDDLSQSIGVSRNQSSFSTGQAENATNTGGSKARKTKRIRIPLKKFLMAATSSGKSSRDGKNRGHMTKNSASSSVMQAEAPQYETNSCPSADGSMSGDEWVYQDSDHVQAQTPVLASQASYLDYYSSDTSSSMPPQSQQSHNPTRTNLLETSEWV